MPNRRRLASLLAAVLLLVGALPAGAVSPVTADGLSRHDADAAAYKGRLIVTWKGLAPTSIRITGARSVDRTSRPYRSVVRAQAGQAAAVAARLRADPRVLSVVPDAAMHVTAWPADAPPNDLLYADQWSLPQIGIPEAWQTTTGDSNLVVAVIDTGFDATHPDLDGVTITSPHNMVWNNNDVADTYGHGTWTSAMIAAETNNTDGIAGIAPGVTIMPIKIMDDEFGISFSDILDGVDWAREHGADIVNMSLGGWLSAEQAALGQPTFTAAREAGMLVVASSGNDGLSLRNYPASFAGVLSVGATDENDARAEFSTYGPALDMVAPGVGIVSAWPETLYETGDGTSASAPEVSGTAALVWSARPGLTADELEAVLRASAVDLGDPGWDNQTGDGRVDAAAALVEPVPDPLPVLDPSPPLGELTLEFTAPTEAVSQTDTSYLVQVAANHAVAESFAIVVDIKIDMGKCKWRNEVDFEEVPFGPEIPLTDLRVGHCYRVYVAALDEDGNYGEATSKPVSVIDPVPPTIIGRRPAPDATGVDTGATIRIRFSERVVIDPGSIALYNEDTKRPVRADAHYDKATDTYIINPDRALARRTWYLVYVGGRIQDRTGNPLEDETWEFRTGR